MCKPPRPANRMAAGGMSKYHGGTQVQCRRAAAATAPCCTHTRLPAAGACLPQPNPASGAASDAPPPSRLAACLAISRTMQPRPEQAANQSVCAAVPVCAPPASQLDQPRQPHQTARRGGQHMSLPRGAASSQAKPQLLLLDPSLLQEHQCVAPAAAAAAAEAAAITAAAAAGSSCCWCWWWCRAPSAAAAAASTSAESGRIVVGAPAAGPGPPLVGDPTLGRIPTDPGVVPPSARVLCFGFLRSLGFLPGW